MGKFAIGDFEAQYLFLIGALIFLFTIILLLKKGKLNIQYSIIWLGAGGVMLVFAVFPILLLHLRNIIGIISPANLVFILGFAFVLLLLLSLSTIVTGFAKRIKRLTQKQALLEKRVRELEALLQKAQPNETGEEQP